MASSREITVQLPSGKTKAVAVAADVPESSTGSSAVGALLTHGASGNLGSGNLPAVASVLAAVGVPTLRFTSLGPLTSRAEVARAVVEAAVQLPGFQHVRQWVAAGHSMGGRVMCEVAHALPDQVAALVLLSYPLHPPGKPHELRDVPLTQLNQPMLFVRGTRDPFSEAAPWEAVMKRMGSRRVVEHRMQGGNHGLAVPGGAEACGVALQRACSKVQQFVEEVAVSVPAQAVAPASQSGQRATRVARPEAAAAQSTHKNKRRRRK